MSKGFGKGTDHHHHRVRDSGTLSALREIRRGNADNEVTLVSMESYLPYSPASLPRVISGRVDDSKIALVDHHFFSEIKLQWIRGKKVEHIDTAKNQVMYDSGRSDYYDKLLITTGSEPVLPPIPGINDVPSFQLRTLNDARALIAKMRESRTAVVLGGGLIGINIAECLIQNGIEVTVIEAAPCILPAYCDAEASTMIENVLERHGVTLLTAERACGVAPKKKGVQVSIEGGRYLETDILVIAAGVRPRDSFLDGSGVNVRGGIVVDERMRTNNPNIWAAGDVASARGFLTEEHAVNPILITAAEEGRVAGCNMIGRDVRYEGWLPTNVLVFFGHRAVSVGKAVPSEGDEVLVRKDETKGTYKKFIFCNDALVGATLLDTDGDAGPLQCLIRRRVDLKNYKEVLLRDARAAGALWFAQTLQPFLSRQSAH